MGRLIDRIRSRAGSSGRSRGRTAFVLGGGGVLGSIQVGQLEALVRAGIVPDVLIGSSVGALNGAAIAARPNLEGIECLRDTWLGLTAEDIFPGSRISRAVNAIRRGDHLHSNSGIRRLAGMVQAHSFSELARPLHVCAANLRTGDEHWFTEGPLEPAILASTAIPGVFPPVVVNDERYVDGGVVNNIPVSRAVELGASTIYVLTCGQARASERGIRRPLDVLIQSFAHSRARRVELDRERYADVARIIEMPVIDTTGISYNDMSQTERLYREALDASTALLAAKGQRRSQAVPA